MEIFTRRTVQILLATNGAVLVAAAMLGPVYALVVGRSGGDPMDAGYVFAAYAATAALVTFIAGYFNDRLQESELIVIAGYVLMGIGFFAYLFTHSLLTLILVQVIVGFGEAIHAPAFDTLLSRQSEKDLGKLWGSWEALNHLSGAIGGAVGALVLAHFGFEVLFVIMAMLCWLSAAYISLLPRNVL